VKGERLMQDYGHRGWESLVRYNGKTKFRRALTPIRSHNRRRRPARSDMVDLCRWNGATLASDLDGGLDTIMPVGFMEM